MMLFIPGWIISLFTFPGVILHEIAHRFFCDLFKVRVYKAEYFISFAERSGCILSEQTNNLTANFWISYGPLFVNTLISVICCFPFFLSYIAGTEYVVPGSIFFRIVMWIGISAGVQAIPSNEDMESMRRLLSNHQKDISFFASGAIGFLDVLCSGINFGSSVGTSFLYTGIVNLIFAKIILLFLI